MACVIVSPGLVVDAAQNLASIGTAVDQAHEAAAPATTSVLASAEDEVSTAIAAVFSEQARAFHAAAARAAQFHNQFVQTLSGSGAAYRAAEAAGASSLQAGTVTTIGQDQLTGTLVQKVGTIQLGGTVTTIGQDQLTGTLVQSLGKTVVTNTGPPGQISVSHAGNLSPAVRLSPPPGSDIDDSGALDTLQDLVLGNDTPMLPHNMLGLGGNMFSGLLTSLPATGTFARSVHALLTYVNQVLASNGMQGVRL